MSTIGTFSVICGHCAAEVVLPITMVQEVSREEEKNHVVITLSVTPDLTPLWEHARDCPGDAAIGMTLDELLADADTRMAEIEKEI